MYLSRTLWSQRSMFLDFLQFPPPRPLHTQKLAMVLHCSATYALCWTEPPGDCTDFQVQSLYFLVLRIFTCSPWWDAYAVLTLAAAVDALCTGVPHVHRQRTQNRHLCFRYWLLPPKSSCWCGFLPGISEDACWSVASVPEFGSEMYPKGQCVEGSILSLWHYWEVAETCGDGT